MNMRMKRFWMLPALAAAMLAMACSSDDDGTGFGQGELQFVCSASDSVANLGTRAGESTDGSTVALPASVIPDGDDFALLLTGTYGEETATQEYKGSWDRLADFHANRPALECTNSDYTAVLSYGDPEAEGPEAAYFEGSAEHIALKAGKTTSVSVAAHLANSCFRLRLDEWMRAYYSEVELTISTDTNSFRFTADSATDDNVIFVRTGQILTIAGSAVKAQNGQSVTFAETAIGNGRKTAAETMHTITLTQGTAGAATLSIRFDDTFTEVEAEEVELNPEY